MKIKILDWATPLGRNSKGQFVSLKNVKVAAASEKPVVEFKSAMYGHNDAKIDITDKLSSKSLGRKVNNTMAGSDPAPKIKKELTVTVAIDGVETTKTFAEGEKLEF